MGDAQRLADHNAVVEKDAPFDPTSLGGKGTSGLKLPKSNWARTLDQGPVRAYPAMDGLTLTYGGV